MASADKAEFSNRIKVLGAVSPNTAATYRSAVRSFLAALPPIWLGAVGGVLVGGFTAHQRVEAVQHRLTRLSGPLVC